MYLHLLSESNDVIYCLCIPLFQTKRAIGGSGGGGLLSEPVCVNFGDGAYLKNIIIILMGVLF